MVRFAIKCLLVFGTIHKLLYWDFIFFFRQTRLSNPDIFRKKLFIGSNISKKWPCNFWTTPMHAEGEEDLIKGKLLSNLYSNSIVCRKLLGLSCLSSKHRSCTVLYNPKKSLKSFFWKIFWTEQHQRGVAFNEKKLLCMIFTILLTLWNSEQKNGPLIKLFLFFIWFWRTLVKL